MLTLALLITACTSAVDSGEDGVGGGDTADGTDTSDTGGESPYFMEISGSIMGFELTARCQGNERDNLEEGWANGNTDPNGDFSFQVGCTGEEERSADALEYSFQVEWSIDSASIATLPIQLEVCATGAEPKVDAVSRWTYDSGDDSDSDDWNCGSADTVSASVTEFSIVEDHFLVAGDFNLSDTDGDVAMAGSFYALANTD